MMEVLETVCKRFKIPLDVAWSDLDRRNASVILYGLPKDETVRMRYVSHSGHSRSFEAGYEGVINNLQRRYRETKSEWVKQEIERLMMQKPCPTCNGARLKPESLAVTIDGMNIAEFCKHSIAAALLKLRHAAAQRARADDRAAGDQGDQGAPRFPARRRARLPHHRSRRRDAFRR